MPLEIVTAPTEFDGEARSVFLAGGITGCEDWQTGCAPCWATWTWSC